MAKKSNKVVPIEPTEIIPEAIVAPAVDPIQESAPEVAAPVAETVEPIVETIVAPVAVDPVRMPTLVFNESFWCAQIGKSIKKGSYVPANAAELQVLQPKAVRTVIPGFVVVKK